MNKILERYIPLREDESMMDVIEYYMKEYSVKRGYRLEFFLSPQFVRVTVYEVIKEK